MKKLISFALGTTFRTLINSIMAFKFAERIVATKQSIKDGNQKKRNPRFLGGQKAG
jgi:hypothetical protein